MRLFIVFADMVGYTFKVLHIKTLRGTQALEPTNLLQGNILYLRLSTQAQGWGTSAGYFCTIISPSCVHFWIEARGNNMCKLSDTKGFTTSSVPRLSIALWLGRSLKVILTK